MPSFDSEQIAQWSGGAWDPCAPGTICGVSNNTRALSAGELYIAIHGERFDGHQFVEDAFEKGASGAMVARSCTLQGTAAQPLLRVADPAEALTSLARTYLQSVAPVTIAVTGSVGKTTVKEITATILGEAMPTARTLGNWNNDIGLPLSILAMELEAQAGVFEVGMNHPGEIAPLCEVLRPQWGVVTAIGPVHIEFFKSVEDIAREKAALLEALPPEGHAVLCLDDPYFDLLRKHVSGELHTVSLTGPADYVVEYAPASDQLRIHESATDATVSAAWPWPGEHNAINAGLAVAVARGLGLEWDVIKRGLERYHPLPMRWEVSEAKGMQIINDAYNANPLSMEAALRAFDAISVPGSKWLVLGDMLELGVHAEPEHLALGAVVASGSWRGLVVVGKHSETIAEGARDQGFAKDRIWCCESNSEVIALLKREMNPGDAVLLKASRGVALEEVVCGMGS